MITKVGILLDSSAISAWQEKIIRYIKHHPGFSVDLIVLNGSSKNLSDFNRVGYKLLRKLDRTLFRVKLDNFEIVNTEDLLTGIEIIEVNPSRGKFTDEFHFHDVAFIKDKRLDLLVRFGFRVLKGEILKAAKYGVLSLHHGDNSVNRGGPPAFWEVVHKEPITGVTLQVLSSDLDGGKVLGKSFVRTDFTSFNRNQNAAYWAGVELFCSKLNELAVSGINQFFAPVERSQKVLGFYNTELYRDPKNLKAAGIFLLFFFTRIGSSLSKILYGQQWCLYYKINNESFENSMYRYKKITPPKDVDWADPFVVKKDGLFYLFFEELLTEKGKAHISCLCFDEKGKIIDKTPQIVLKEDHHLSYPFVFNYEGQYYMTPEASTSSCVWLYRCEEFPDRWVKFKKLLDNVTLYDPTLYFHEGCWFLFGTQKPFEGNSPHQYLYIYYSDNLLEGEWKPHPNSPVTRDVRGARPAGRIFEHQGKLIRPSQIGAPKYGYGIRFYEIIKLSPVAFEEAPLEDILPNWQKDLLATHTFNFVNGFSVVDAQVKRKRFS